MSDFPALDATRPARTNADDFWPVGRAAQPGYATRITPEDVGWTYCGLSVIELADGQTQELATGPDEVVVVPSFGGASIEVDGQAYVLRGRPSVFAGPTDSLYLPISTTASIRAKSQTRLIIAHARAKVSKPIQLIPAESVPVIERGYEATSRTVFNIAMLQGGPDVEKILVCEVITPGGHWSGYPAHKHEEATEHESVLEEMYYFEIAPNDPGEGFGYMRVKGSGDAYPIDVLAEVHTGDVITVPWGWHGPNMAAPGFDMYYLNVMAGPGQGRAWMFSDDPNTIHLRDAAPQKK